MTGAFESPTLITPHILVGDRADAMDLGFLLRYGVTHVLNTTKQLRPHHEAKFIYLQARQPTRALAQFQEPA